MGIINMSDKSKKEADEEAPAPKTESEKAREAKKLQKKKIKELAEKIEEEGLPKPLISQMGLAIGISVCIGLVFFFVFFFVVGWAKNNSEGCGIDVWTWLQVFIALVTLGSLILCPILCCFNSQNPLKAFTWALLLILALSIVIAAWVIYGYVIYFSDSNDCQKSYDTSVALVFICIFLILGLCCIIQAIGLAIYTPIVYFGQIRPMLNDEESTEKKKFFRNLAAISILLFKGEQEKKKKKSDSDSENEGGDDEDHALI